MVNITNISHRSKFNYEYLIIYENYANRDDLLDLFDRHQPVDLVDRGKFGGASQ